MLFISDDCCRNHFSSSRLITTNYVRITPPPRTMNSDLEVYNMVMRYLVDFDNNILRDGLDEHDLYYFLDRRMQRMSEMHDINMRTTEFNNESIPLRLVKLAFNAGMRDSTAEFFGKFQDKIDIHQTNDNAECIESIFDMFRNNMWTLLTTVK